MTIPNEFPKSNDEFPEIFSLLSIFLNRQGKKSDLEEIAELETPTPPLEIQVPQRELASTQLDERLLR